MNPFSSARIGTVLLRPLGLRVQNESRPHPAPTVRNQNKLAATFTELGGWAARCAGTLRGYEAALVLRASACGPCWGPVIR